jgi:hypothetical protein
VNNSIPETQAIAGIRLTSPYARTAVVCPWDFPCVVEFEFHEGEPASVSGSPDNWHPGYPPNVALLSCRVGGVDITEMLSNSQQERIEDACCKT